MNKLPFDLLNLCYVYLENKISHAFETAINKNKKILIVIGESHSSKAHNLLEFCVFDIANTLGIKNFYHESSKENANFAFSESYDDLRMANRYNMKYMPIDTEGEIVEIQGIFASSEEGMQIRNKAMVQRLNEYADNGVSIIGGYHMIGMFTDLEGNKIDSDRYEIVDISLSEGAYFETIPNKSLGLALDYYLNQDMTLQSILKELTKTVDLETDKSIKIFSDFMDIRKNLMPLDLLKSCQDKYNAALTRKIYLDYFEIVLYRYRDLNKDEKKIVNNYLIEAFEREAIANNIFEKFGFEILYKSEELLLIFIKYGANLNVRSNGYSLLECALNYKINLFELLLKGGADPFATTYEGLDLIEKARSLGNEDAIKMIQYHQNQFLFESKSSTYIRKKIAIVGCMNNYFDDLTNKLAKKILNFSKELTNDCPSYFPSQGRNYWNSSNNLNLFDPNFQSSLSTKFITQPCQYACNPYYSIG